MKREAVFTPLDLRAWERGETFYYFARMAPTGYSLTVNMDATETRRALHAEGYKFFPAYLWLVTKTLSRQREFMIAERDGQVGYYNILTPLYATFHEDEKTFSLMWTEYDDDFSAFHAEYLRGQTECGRNHGILARKGETPPPNAYTVSCLPWVSFEHFSVQSYENKPYYFPSIEAGKFFERDGKTLMPLSITCHHAATDGWHVAKFLEELQEQMNEIGKILK